MDDFMLRRSPWRIRLFQAYAARFAARHFHGVRMAIEGRLDGLPPGPVIVAMNHASWWDPILAAILARRFTGRVHGAPIDSVALGAYRFFRRLGFFGVEPGTSRGLAQLVDGGGQLLSRPDGVLWITPQGHFRDPRQRPLRLRRGIGHLLHRMRGGTLVPLAIEYPFWTERLPEALVQLGDPVAIADGTEASPEEWTLRAAAALQETQDRLATLAMTGDAEAFETLVGGETGVNPVYDAWRRVRALLSGGSFRPEHRDLVRASRGAP